MRRNDERKCVHTRWNTKLSKQQNHSDNMFYCRLIYPFWRIKLHFPFQRSVFTSKRYCNNNVRNSLASVAYVSLSILICNKYSRKYPPPPEKSYYLPDEQESRKSVVKSFPFTHCISSSNGNYINITTELRLFFLLSIKKISNYYLVDFHACLTVFWLTIF